LPSGRPFTGRCSSMSVWASNWARPRTNHRLDRLIADGREAVGDRRVDRDRVAGLQDVLVEADPDLESPGQDVAPFVARVSLERVGWAGRATGLVRDPQELHPGLRERRQPLPQHAGVQPDPVAIARPLDRRGDGHRAGRRRSGGRGGARDRFAGPAIVEQQLVERHVELGGDRVERAHGRVRAPGLDLGDQARRHPEAVGEDAQGQAARLARFAKPLADLRVVRSSVTRAAGSGQPWSSVVAGWSQE